MAYVLVLFSKLCKFVRFEILKVTYLVVQAFLNVTLCC